MAHASTSSEANAAPEPRTRTVDVTNDDLKPDSGSERTHPIRHLRLISDFNIEILGRYLANMRGLERAQVNVAPFGQVFQILASSDESGASDEAVVLWTRPEGIFEHYRKALYWQRVDHEAVLDELDRYSDLIRKQAARTKYLFHPSWTLPGGHRGYGMLDFTSGIGLTHLLARMNLRLGEQLADLHNVFILNTEQWLRHAGPRASIPKMWFASKVPYKNVVFQAAARDIAAALNGLNGRSRNLVILDLDNPLWGGVVGEVGWEGLQLGGHDHVGEAYLEFQRCLKALTDRGVQLAIVSKNDERVALEAIDRHPEMQLKRQDFAGWRINWSDKAQNIVNLVEELRLGIDSVVFIDDNPAERARVREAFEDRVLVPEWPADPSEYSTALLELQCFDTPIVSTEDRARTEMYAAERERHEAYEEVGSLEAWLATLEMEVRVENLSRSNLSRAAQLLNKTNQMNMSTRRLAEDELMAWARPECRRVWTIRVADRFGDSGLTGIISIETEGETTRIVDFLMSCRVMGRCVEETMVFLAVEHARRLKGVKQMVAKLLPTERNRPCAEFWQRSGFEEQESNCFCWELARPYPKPAFIKLIDSCDSETAGG